MKNRLLLAILLVSSSYVFCSEERVTFDFGDDEKVVCYNSKLSGIVALYKGMKMQGTRWENDDISYEKKNGEGYKVWAEAWTDCGLGQYDFGAGDYEEYSNLLEIKNMLENAKSQYELRD